MSRNSPLTLIGLRRSQLAQAVMSTLLLPSAAMASQAVEFNRNFLYGKSAQQVDLDRFEKGDMLPGIYSADVRINGATVGRRDVEVRAMDDGSTAVCLTPQLVDLFGLNATRVEARRVVSEQTGEVTRLRGCARCRKRRSAMPCPTTFPTPPSALMPVSRCSTSVFRRLIWHAIRAGG
jgi:outer membrane usher protein